MPPNQTLTPNQNRTYQGKQVTIIRAAQQGDQGYDDREKQSLVKMADGTQRAVKDSELTAVV